MSLELRGFFYTISVAWNECAGQLAAGGVASVGGREFDPRRVHDTISVPLWVYVRFPVQEHQNKTNKYVYRQRLILDSSVGLSVGIQSAGDSGPETLWVRILHSVEEDNLQQRKTTCLLSIRISLACARASKLTTTNMYVCMYVCMHACMHVCMYAECSLCMHVCMYAECSLIIGTGSRVQVFSLILDSSVGLSASIQSAGDLVSGTPGSNPAFSRGTQLVSFRFEYRLPVPEHRN